MSQLPLPTPSVDTVRVPLPASFETWRDLYLQGLALKLAVLLTLAVLLYFAARLARRAVGEHIEEVNRRHTLRKWIGYAYTALLALLALALFAESLTGLGTVLAVLVAGVAVALQDLLKSVVGWLYISSRSGIEVGSRIEVDGVVGDVIDVGVLKTTLLEVGNLVYGQQSTGRLVTIPNHHVLSKAAFVSPAGSPFVWHEVKVTVTYESDWRAAEEQLRQIGEELHTEVAGEVEQGFRRLERRYAFRYGTTTPIVYVSLAPHGVDLTLRFLIHTRRQRGTLDRITRRILDAFPTAGAHLAYPTYRAYRRGEPAPAAPPPPPRSLEEGSEEGLPPPDMMGD